MKQRIKSMVTKCNNNPEIAIGGIVILAFIIIASYITTMPHA